MCSFYYWLSFFVDYFYISSNFFFFPKSATDRIVWRLEDLKFSYAVSNLPSCSVSLYFDSLKMKLFLENCKLFNSKLWLNQYEIALPQDHKAFLWTIGQLISEGNFGIFKPPKKWTFFIRTSALASKMD